MSFPTAGYGSVTNDRCNTVTHADYCPECHTVGGLWFYHCHNWACPVCLPWNADAAAKDVADRLIGVFRAWRAIGQHPGNLNHIVLSVPASEYWRYTTSKRKSKKGVKSPAELAAKMKARAEDFAKEIGISGGSIAFHEFRVKKELQRPIVKAMKKSGMVGGVRDGVRANVLNLSSDADYMEYGPHYHINGFFWMKEKSSDFQVRTGWTYKNVTVTNARKNKTRCLPESYESIRRIAAYQLDHHSITSPGAHAVTYFGKASYKSVSKESRKTKELKTCLRCSGQMYKVAVDSERQLVEMKAGVYGYVVDDRSIKSRVTTVTNWYTARTEQATINRYHVLPPPVC